MRHGMNVVRTVLWRDFLVLWPLALLVAMLLAVNPFVGDVKVSLIRELFPPLAALSCAIISIGLVQQDAAASLRHDWLTRPIGRGELLVAKLVFLFLVVIVPMVLGDLVHGLAIDGFSLGEAVSRALSLESLVLTIVLLSCTAAAITSTFLEAAGAAIAVAVMVILLASGILLVVGEGGFFSGSAWIVTSTLYAAVLASTALVLWLQYLRRSTVGARLALAAVAAGTTLAVVTVPFPMVFALQKAVAAELARAESFALQLAADCFPSANIEFGEGPGAQYTGPNYTAETALIAWDGDTRRQAGAHAIAFLSSARIDGVPEGWRPMISHVQTTVMTADGRPLTTLEPGRHTAVWGSASDGTPVAQHAFLLPRAQYEEFAAQAARLRLDYSVSLLRPVLTVDVPVDDERRFFPGLGYCSAVTEARIRRTVLSCWMNQMHPALLVAYADGVPAMGMNVGTPDYRPSMLGFLGDAEHTTTLPAAVPTVRLTAFQAAAHVSRQVETSAILGSVGCRPPTYGE